MVVPMLRGLRSSRLWTLGASVLAAAVLGGCSGGGASPRAAMPGAAAPSAGTTAPATTANARVSVRVTIPAATAADAKRRRPAYVSTATQSLTLAQNGGTPATISLSASSSNCTAGAGGSRACSFSIAATPGANQSFVVKTFASADGTGSPLSLGSVTADITAGTTNTLSFALNGVVAGIKFGVPAEPAFGISQGIDLGIDAIDASGATIVGPEAYVDANGNPVTITLTNSDTSNATSLEETSLTAPAQVFLNYSGRAIATDTITASAPNVPPASLTLTFTCLPPLAGQYLYAGEQLYNAGYQAYSLPSLAPEAGVDPPGLGLQPEFDTMAVDDAGRVYVPLAAGGTAEFCPQAYEDGAVPYRTLDTGSSIALDAARDVYTNDSNRVDILEYPPDSGAPATSASVAPLRTIAGGPSSFSSILAIGVAGGDVFVSDGFSNALFGFGPAQSGAASPAITIANNSAGLLRPASIVADRSGDVYVSYGADWKATRTAPAGGAIAEYGPGDRTTPIHIITGSATGIAGNGKLAVDAAGNVYLCQPSSVEEFAAGADGNVAPLASVALSGAPGGSLNSPNQIAIDPNSGDFYVATSSYGVFVFGSTGSYLGQIAPSAGGIGSANGLAFDPSGELIVQSTAGATSGIDALLYYPAGTTSSATPVKTIPLGADNWPSNLATDAVGDVVEHGVQTLGYTIAEFSASARSGDRPIATFYDPVSADYDPTFQQSSVVDSNGNFDLADPSSNNVFVYAPGTTGNNATQTRALGQYAASTDGVFALAGDTAGNLYAASLDSASISVYPPGATTPSRTIVGPHTRLGLPTSVAADDAGDIFVDSQNDATILEFGPSANGDAAPIAVLGNATKGPQFAALVVGPAAVAMPHLGFAHTRSFGSPCPEGDLQLAAANLGFVRSQRPEHVGCRPR